MDTKVVKEALPLYLKGNCSKAILIIHGFGGYTGEFYDISYKLNELGYTVSLPRLPGHGTNKKDFLLSGWKEWLNHVKNCYLDLRAEYDTVEIIGLSMGGVLTLILASIYRPKRIILLAPAMAANNRLFYLTPILKFFIKEVPDKWEAKPTDSQNIKKLGREYWSYNSPKQLSKLYKLMRIAKKGLKHITCPTLLMLSKEDKSVPLKAGDIIRDGLTNGKIDEIILEKSGHVLISGEEKDLVEETILTWLNK